MFNKVHLLPSTKHNTVVLCIPSLVIDSLYFLCKMITHINVNVKDQHASDVAAFVIHVPSIEGRKGGRMEE